MRIDSTGALILAATNSNGIQFPSNQVANANANALDDYEEGSWTPSQGAGLTVVGAYSSAGTYIKVGKQVTCIGSITGATSVASTGNTVMVGALPFTVSAAPAGTGVGLNAAETVVVGLLTVASGTTVNSSAFAATGTVNFSLVYQI